MAIPAKILDIDKETAKVDFGQGILRDVNITLVNVKKGDYVLVHAGYAIQVLDRNEALETLSLWREVLQSEAT